MHVETIVTEYTGLGVSEQHVQQMCHQQRINWEPIY